MRWAPPKYWTPARHAELELLWSEGKSDEDMAAHFGRPVFGIQNQRWKLGLARNGAVRSNLQPWPDLPKDAFR